MARATMTRMHFEMVAKWVQAARGKMKPVAFMAWTQQVINDLAATNPAFDVDRFREAVGY